MTYLYYVLVNVSDKVTKNFILEVFWNSDFYLRVESFLVEHMIVKLLIKLLHLMGEKLKKITTGESWNVQLTHYVLSTLNDVEDVYLNFLLGYCLWEFQWILLMNLLFVWRVKAINFHPIHLYVLEKKIQRLNEIWWKVTLLKLLDNQRTQIKILKKLKNFIQSEPNVVNFCLHLKIWVENVKIEHLLITPKNMKKFIKKHQWYLNVSSSLLSL